MEKGVPVATQAAVAAPPEGYILDDPGFDDPMFDPDTDDGEPLNDAEREIITTNLQASGMAPEEIDQYLADDGPDGARQWYRRNWRQNRALQDARARRAALRDERERNAGVSGMASAVVARDVAAHGSGARLGKAVGETVTSIPWVGLLGGGLAALVIGVVIGLLTTGPTNAVGQPTGPVGVDQVGAGQPETKLVLANGSLVDFSFGNLTNSTCPPGTIGGVFGAGYTTTLNPDGSIVFTHEADSPFAPDLKGPTGGTSVTLDGMNQTEQVKLTGNFNQLNNPTSFNGKAGITLSPGTASSCGGDFDAKADVKAPAGGAQAVPPATLADVVRPGSGLGATQSNSSGMRLAWLLLTGIGAAFIIAAALLAWTGRPHPYAPHYQPGSSEDNAPNDPDDYDDQSPPYDPEDEPPGPRMEIGPPEKYGFDPAPPLGPGESDVPPTGRRSGRCRHR